MMALAIALALGALAGASIAAALAREDYERLRAERTLAYEQWRQLRFEGMRETIVRLGEAALASTFAFERFADSLAAHERRLRKTRE